jgi:hypothetical protein
MAAGVNTKCGANGLVRKVEGILVIITVEVSSRVD